MSIKAITSVLRTSIDVTLGGHNRRVGEDRTRLVLLYLAYRAHLDTGVANPSVATISADVCVPEGSVRYALRVLEANGLIKAIGSKSGGRSSTRYRITPPATAGGRAPGTAGGDGEATPPGTAADPTRYRASPPAVPGAEPPEPEERRDSGGGGGGELRSAEPTSADAESLDPDTIADVLADIGRALGREVVPTDDIVNELQRLAAAGWYEEDIVHRVVVDLDDDIRSAAGWTRTRLRALTAPDIVRMRKTGAQRIGGDRLADLERCRCTTSDRPLVRGKGIHAQAVEAIAGNDDEGPWIEAQTPAEVRHVVALFEAQYGACYRHRAREASR